MQSSKPFLAALSCFAALMIAGCLPAAPPVSISDEPIPSDQMYRLVIPPGPTKPVEELSWDVLDGGKGKIGDMKGKVLVLDFWATYCPPCIEEIPHLRQLQAKYGDKGFQVIGLNVGGEEDHPRIPAFSERLNIDYPIAIPDDYLVYQLLGNDSRIPQTLVFDREGKLVKKLVSYDENVKRQLDEAVASAVGES